MKIYVYTNCEDNDGVYITKSHGESQQYIDPQSDRHREAIALLDAVDHPDLPGASYIAGVGDKRTFEAPPRVAYWLDKEWS